VGVAVGVDVAVGTGGVTSSGVAWLSPPQATNSNSTAVKRSACTALRFMERHLTLIDCKSAIDHWKLSRVETYPYTITVNWQPDEAN